MSIRVNGKAIAGSSVSGLKKYKPYNVYKKEDVVYEVSNDRLVYFISLIDNNAGNALSIESAWKKIELDATGSGSGHDLFDVVSKDHVLTYEESKGYTRLGDYAYKTPKLNSYFGYADFYNKCLEEYKEAEEIIILKDSFNKVGSPKYVDGIMSEFTTSVYATMPESFNSAIGSKSWEIVAKFKLNGLNQENPIYGGTSGTYLMDIYISTNNKFALGLSSNGSSYNICTNLEGTHTVQGNKWYWVKLIYNGEYYQLSYSTDNETWIPDIKVNDATVLEPTTDKLCIGFRNAATFGINEIDLKECYIDIDGQRWWTGANYALKHSSGHIYYDIKEQPYINQLWAYGIDQEEERILLPVSQDRFVVEKKEATDSDPSWYTLYSDGWLEQGGVQTAEGKVTYLKEFANTNYFVTRRVYAGSTSSTTTQVHWNVSTFGLTSKTTNSYSGIVSTTYGITKYDWYACGYSNQVSNLITKYMVTGNAFNDIGYIDIVRQSNEGIADIQETKDSSLAEMNDQLQEYKQEMYSYKQDLVQSIIEEAGNEAEEAKYWADVASLSSSNALYDIKTTDHLLSGPDANGWELQGSYVNKNAVLNDHLGYPSFYERCLKEKSEGVVRNHLNSYNGTTVGSPTKNDGIVSNFSDANYMLIPKPDVFNSYEAQFKFKYTATSTVLRCPIGQYKTNMASTQIELESSGEVEWLYTIDGATWLTLDTNLILPIDTWCWIKMIWDGSNITVYSSTDGKNFNQGTSTACNKLHWVEEQAIGYDVAVNDATSVTIDLNESYIKLDGELYWKGTNRFNTYKHSNGHTYYDIMDKKYIDDMKAKSPLALYYGIDEENERILLPDNYHGDLVVDYVNGTSWYKLYADGWCEQGGNCSIKYSTTITVNLIKELKNANYYVAASALAMGNVSDDANITTLTTTSFKIYSSNVSPAGDYGTKQCRWIAKGYAEIPSPESSNHYTYICVGNTKADTSWINLTEQVNNSVKEVEDTKQNSLKQINNLNEEVVDEINTLTDESVIEIDTLREESIEQLENLRDAGVNALNNASNALTQTQITNCILEMPKRLNYTLVDKTFTLKAGSVIILPYGVEDLAEQYPKGSTFRHDKFKVHDTQFIDNKFFIWLETQEDISYYREVTTSYRLLFCLDLASGNFASADVSNSHCGEAPTKNGLFYSTTDNIIRYATDGVLNESIYALPSGLCQSTGTNIFDKLVTIFDGMGYIGSYFWVDKGVKGLIPNGRNEDGTLNNIEYTSNELIWYTNPVSFNSYIGLSPDGVGMVRVNDLIYDRNANYLYFNQEISRQFVVADCMFGNPITNFNPRYPVSVLHDGVPHIIESYRNGTSWYRVWSDGWCEQGSTGTYNTTALVITLLKNYINTDYHVSVYKRGNDNDTGGYADSHCEINGKSPYDNGQAIDSFRCSTVSGSAKYTWKAEGYIK